MNISTITSNAAQGQNQKQNAPSGSSKLGKDAFLQLLVAQMKNQDPTNPMDGRKLVTQLAQFNSVEQLINLNDGMSDLMKNQSNMSKSLVNTMASTLAGKKVEAVSDKVQLQAGKKSTIQFRLGNIADKVNISIIDSAGNIVKTGQLQNLSDGIHNWTWNGKTNNGNRAPEGVYEIQIKAQNGDDNVGAVTYQKGVAEKVRYTPNGVKLMVNGVPVSLGNVKEIGI